MLLCTTLFPYCIAIPVAAFDGTPIAPIASLAKFPNDSPATPAVCPYEDGYRSCDTCRCIGIGAPPGIGVDPIECMPLPAEEDAAPGESQGPGTVAIFAGGGREGEVVCGCESERNATCFDALSFERGLLK